MKTRDELKEIIKDWIIGILLIICILLVLIILYKVSTKEEIIESNPISIIDTTASIEEIDEYYVDIKGAVKKPGVYKVPSGSIVNDVIKLAGGLKSNAYTSNINLSQVTTKEMVIYIYTNSEIKKLSTTVTSDTKCTTNVIEVNNCVSTTTKVNTETNSNKVNINTASKEELMTLSGIGESKAIAIIKYREENKFISVEDLKNVSGIGDSLYDSIKDNITV